MIDWISSSTCYSLYHYVRIKWYVLTDSMQKDKVKKPVSVIQVVGYRPRQELGCDGRQDASVEGQWRYLGAGTATSLAGIHQAAPRTVLGVTLSVCWALYLGVQVKQQTQTLRPGVDQVRIERQLEPVDSRSVRTDTSTSQLVCHLHWRYLPDTCTIL